MFNNLLKSGKINNVILGEEPQAVEKPIIRKYHKYFRQRDTLLNIPKELEKFVELKDKENYNSAKQEAADRVAELKKSKTETSPIYDKDYGLTEVKTKSEE